jgi:hypothetical protein
MPYLHQQAVRIQDRNTMIIGLDCDTTARFVHEVPTPQSIWETTPLKSLCPSSTNTLHPIRAMLTAQCPLGPDNIDSIILSRFKPRHRRSSDAYSTLSETPFSHKVSSTSAFIDSPFTSSPFLSDQEGVMTNTGLSCQFVKEPSSLGAIAQGSANPMQTAADRWLVYFARITDMLRNPREPHTDVLGALALTFDIACMTAIFPEHNISIQVLQNEQTITHYQLQAEYSAHLIATMTLVTDVLNDYSCSITACCCKYGISASEGWWGITKVLYSRSITAWGSRHGITYTMRCHGMNLGHWSSFCGHIRNNESRD